MAHSRVARSPWPRSTVAVVPPCPSIRTIGAPSSRRTTVKTGISSGGTMPAARATVQAGAAGYRSRSEAMTSAGPTMRAWSSRIVRSSESDVVVGAGPITRRSGAVRLGHEQPDRPQVADQLSDVAEHLVVGVGKLLGEG